MHDRHFIYLENSIGPARPVQSSPVLAGLKILVACAIGVSVPSGLLDVVRVVRLFLLLSLLNDTNVPYVLPSVDSFSRRQ